jgi:hypothetical protein
MAACRYGTKHPRKVEEIIFGPILDNLIPFLSHERVGLFSLAPWPLNVDKRVSTLQLLNPGPCITI